MPTICSNTAVTPWHEDPRIQELTDAIRTKGRREDVHNLIAHMKNILGPDSDEQIAEWSLQTQIILALVPFLDAAKIRKYFGVNFNCHVQPHEVDAEVCASYEAMQARGGLSAAIDALRSGSKEDALLAAKALAALLDGANALEQLASSDIVRTILLTVEWPDVPRADKNVLDISVQRLIVQCPGFAEAFLVAYSDGDTRVCFLCSKLLPERYQERARLPDAAEGRPCPNCLLRAVAPVHVLPYICCDALHMEEQGVDGGASGGRNCACTHGGPP